MDIGTAKPSEDEKRGIPHHMLDVVEPDTVYTVASYKHQAGEILQSLLEKNQTPIVCGGTGFYARALLEGLSIPEVAPNVPLRQKLKDLASEKGADVLFEKLEQLDPISALKINPNDIFRVIRAIEVTQSLGIPFSQASRTDEVPFKVIWLGLDFKNREVLRSRIEKRLAEQIDMGLEGESKFLFEKFGPTRPLLNAVTYKQFFQYFENRFTYEEAIADCIRHNYQLARKQLIWFRANTSMLWLTVDAETSILEQAQAHLEALSPG